MDKIENNNLGQEVKCTCPELGDDDQPFYCGQTCSDKDRIKRVDKWISEHLTEDNDGDTVYDPEGAAWRLFFDTEGAYARLIESPETMVSLAPDGSTKDGVTFKLK